MACQVYSMRTILGSPCRFSTEIWPFSGRRTGYHFHMLGDIQITERAQMNSKRILIGVLVVRDVTR